LSGPAITKKFIAASRVEESNINWTFDITVTDALLDGLVDLLLLPKNWTLPTSRFLPFLRGEIDEQEEAHIRATYEVFDPRMRAFVSHR